MWVITKDGFLSVVQNNEDRTRMRVRARRRVDLARAFPDHQVIDLDETGKPYDYRWHLDIARGEWIDYLVEAAHDVDYTSHAKEAMSGGDKEMYSALLDIWTRMYRLQDGGFEFDDDYDFDHEARPENGTGKIDEAVCRDCGEPIEPDGDGWAHR